MFVLLITFPTLYLVQAGNSAVNHILTNKTNALKASERGDIRLMLTKIEPEIRDLISNDQPQRSK